MKNLKLLVSEMSEGRRAFFRRIGEDTRWLRWRDKVVLVAVPGSQRPLTGSHRSLRSACQRSFQRA